MEGGRRLDKASQAIMRGFVFALQAQESHGRVLNRSTTWSVLSQKGHSGLLYEGRARDNLAKH